MKCLACDKVLSDQEATRRYINSDGSPGEFIDLCNHCMIDTDIMTLDVEWDEPLEEGEDDGEVHTS